MIYHCVKLTRTVASMTYRPALCNCCSSNITMRVWKTSRELKRLCSISKNMLIISCSSQTALFDNNIGEQLPNQYSSIQDEGCQILQTTINYQCELLFHLTDFIFQIMLLATLHDDKHPWSVISPKVNSQDEVLVRIIAYAPFYKQQGPPKNLTNVRLLNT